MATQQLKRCPKSTCWANSGFRQIQFSGPETKCPYCGSTLVVIGARRPPAAKSGSKGGGKSISRASSNPTVGHKKRHKPSRKRLPKQWGSSLKDEQRKRVPRKSAPRKDAGRKRG